MKPSPHSLNHSLSFLPLPHSLNYISRLCLSPSSPSQLSPNRSLVHIAGHSLNHSLPLPHFLNHSLISASLPHRRRNSAQIAAHSLNHFLPLSHTYLCLFPSSLSSSFGTLSVLILLSFMSIFIFCPIFKGNQVYFSNKNNNQERERKKKSNRNSIH